MSDADQRFVTKSGAETSLLERMGSTRPGLPLSLMRQSVRRLRIMALMATAVMAISWFGANLIEGDLPHELRYPIEWVPNVTILLASFLILLITWRSWLSLPATINAGLAYEVVVSYCIPISQYWNAFYGLTGGRLEGDLVGLSSVALWMIFFTVLVPAQPRSALIALTLSGASVPITMGVLIRIGNAPAPPPMDFVFIFVLPYVIIVILSYIAARIIYGLGREIDRAQRMGSYHLQRRIGHGGMGEVWLARHNLLARPAAIKLIRRDALGVSPSAQNEAIMRFEREAQITADLESPHTVQLYDFGVSEDGSLFYVMELLEGVDLETLVQQFGPLPAGRTIHILQQVCLSLGEAHRQGLLHRDIKPANIYLCERAYEPDFVKVLDFGLAKQLATYADSEDTSMTAAQTIVGTPAYVAPEMVINKDAVDARADIYSLGCVAFWLLTGRVVFEADTPFEMIIAHTNATPPHPSSCTEISIPAELDDLILACLAKSPDERPSTVADLARWLDEFELKQPWTRERAEQWWQLHRPHETGTTT
jgi:serine/threonine-protein kinase